MNKISQIILKYKWHFLFWFLLIAYVSLSPWVYQRQIARKSNLNESKEFLTTRTTEARMHMDGIFNVNRNLELYKLLGWGFSTVPELKSVNEYDRLLILKSADKAYIIPVVNELREDVRTAFPAINQDLSNSGFSVEVRKDAVPSGIYDIGLIFRFKNGNESLFWSDFKLIRNKNIIAIDRATVQN